MVEKITQNPNMNIDNTAAVQLKLKAKLQEVKDKQGFLGSIWNGIKEITGCGLSASDCDNMLEKFQKGEISLAQAIDYIQQYDNKQSEMTDLGANILTGIGSIAGATLILGTGPIGWVSALLAGAPLGAALKTGIKVADRASNNIKDDEFDTKMMAKDAITGAVTGMISAVSSGVGLGIKAKSMTLSVKNGTRVGAECGAVAGATNYITDVAFDENRKFDLGELASTTLLSTFVSGTVGGFVGAGMYKLSPNVGKNVKKSVKETIIDDSTASTSRKVLGAGERAVLATA